MGLNSKLSIAAGPLCQGCWFAWFHGHPTFTLFLFIQLIFCIHVFNCRAGKSRVPEDCDLRQTEDSRQLLEEEVDT